MTRIDPNFGQPPDKVGVGPVQGPSVDPPVQPVSTPIPVPSVGLPAELTSAKAPRAPGLEPPRPSTIVKGMILAALPALNMYQVNLGTMGVVTAYYVSTAGGSNVFRPSTTQTTTLHAGVHVWVALDPENNRNGFILGVAQTSAPLLANSRSLGVYPQVVGLETDPKNNNVALQLDGKIGQAAGPVRAKNFNPGIADTTSGDWAVSNFEGGGVSVEAYRIWVGGGPMNGLTFFVDEETTRISGLNFEAVTMAEEYEDKVMGRSLVSIRRRVDFPSDALSDNPPNLLEVSGQSYAGASSFKSVRPLDNPGQLKPDTESGLTQRPALLFEYRGVDGTYLLNSASSITLQKWAGVLMPIEIIQESEREMSTVKDFPGVIPGEEEGDEDDDDSGLEFPAPQKVIPERPVINGEEDLALLSGEAVLSRPRSETNPLQGVGNTPDIVAGIIGFQASRAFLNTRMWKLLTGSLPEYMKDRPIDEVNGDPGMWKRVPKFFALNLNSYGSSKRFYLGRAMISLTDEGGILLQDAWGSQIVMSGGNIYVTAEHSVIRNAGRDNIDLSGRDHTLTAARHVDAYASGGRASLVAGTQLTLVGGNSGEHGVLIQSKGKGSSMLLNGDDSDIAASNSGVVIKSEGAVDVEGKGIRLESDTGAVGIKTEAGLLVEAGDLSAALSSTGLWLCDPDNAEDNSVLLSPYGSAMPRLAVTNNLLIYGLSNTFEQQSANYAYGGNPVEALRKNIGNIAPDPIPAGPNSDIYPGFLSSKNYGTDSASLYAIPEAAWATRLRTAASGTTLQLRCVWKMNAISGSYPSPGKQHWSAGGLWKMTPTYQDMGTNYSDQQPQVAMQEASLSGMLRGI